MARLSVHIVSWNSAKVLGDALDSLRAQSFKDFTLTVVDNASTDGSVDLVRGRFPEATVLRNFKNLGFSAAHNQAIVLARQRWTADDKRRRSSIDRYVLVMNPDIILTPTFLEKLLSGVDGSQEIGLAGGKLLKVYPREAEHGDPRFSDVIDSVGLSVRPNRRVSDRGSGETDRGQYDEAEEVFGISGALALYRAEALDAAVVAGEVFDEDFFAYKEDADLAWRLRLLGWKCAYVPSALAYHYRGTGGAERAGLLEMFSRRQRRSLLVNRLSTRNHLLLLAKNEQWPNLLLHGLLIFLYEAGKFLAVALTAPAVLTSYGDALFKLPRALAKRRRVMAKRKASAKEIRKWFK
jgi:GT2 family glycosyltransferase